MTTYEVGNLTVNVDFSGGGKRSVWGRVQSQVERQRCCN